MKKSEKEAANLDRGPQDQYPRSGCTARLMIAVLTNVLGRWRFFKIQSLCHCDES